MFSECGVCLLLNFGYASRINFYYYLIVFCKISENCLVLPSMSRNFGGEKKLSSLGFHSECIQCFLLLCLPCLISPRIIWFEASFGCYLWLIDVINYKIKYLYWEQGLVEFVASSFVLLFCLRYGESDIDGELLRIKIF